MFDIGSWEILLILTIGLFVLGPERLMATIKYVSATVTNFKSLANSVNDQLHKELRIKELHQSVEDIAPAIDEQIDDINHATQQLNKQLTDMGIQLNKGMQQEVKADFK